MKRTTTPDEYTPVIRHIVQMRKARRISPMTFAAIIAHIWEMRHAS